MLSPQGRFLLAGSLVAGVAGRILGLDELLAAGAAGVAIAILSVLYVRAHRSMRLVARSLEPSRIHVGDDCQVRLRMFNPGRFRTPVLHIADRFVVSTEASTTSFDTPEMLMAPVPARGDLEVAYQLPTKRRGRVSVGPLTLTLTDPLVVSARHIRFEEPCEVLIYPAVHPLEPPPHRPGNTFEAVRRSPLPHSGDELYGLRPFQQGDDPRRIHWRSSAHHDELIVRQLEELSPIHTTLLLDTRMDPTGTKDGQNRFETMVSAAASICRACQRRGDRIRLITSADFDSGYGSDPAHLHKIYEHLAMVGPQPGSLLEAVDRLDGKQDGALVVVAAALDGTESGLFNSPGSQLGSRTVVLFAGTGSSPPELTETGTPRTAAGAVVWVNEPSGFVEAWTRHAASPTGIATAIGPDTPTDPTTAISPTTPTDPTTAIGRP